MALERASIVFQTRMDDLLNVYENEVGLKDCLILNNLYIYDEDPDTTNQDRLDFYKEILTILENNSELVSSYVITDLLVNTDLRSGLDGILDSGSFNDEVVRQLIYSYKYGTVKSFFLNNYTDFIPSYDAEVITNNAKLKIWQDAFMREFDRFSMIIDNIKGIQDIDTVAEEYLDYIAQLVGFERGDTALGDSLFREITKNIIEVYRIKGTNYSFELFFNFIGFEIKIIEYWFDKRFYFSTETVNPYTKEYSEYKFAHYLTPNKPTESYPDKMPIPFVAMENEITEIRNGLTFDKVLEDNSPTKLKKMLNVDGVPDYGMDYTYFKTNIIEYSINKLTSGVSEEGLGLSEDDENTIQAYTDFLTPIFISKKIVVNITPFEDEATNLILKDSNQIIDEVSTSMFVANMAGTILRRIAAEELTDGVGGEEQIATELELWDWTQDNMDRLVNRVTFPIPKDNINLLANNSMYDDIDETLNAQTITYPYIENKPDTEFDFTLESSTSNINSDSLMKDHIYMSARSRNYIPSGGINLSGSSITSKIDT